jgi:hypothetical protein
MQQLKLDSMGCNLHPASMYVDYSVVLHFAAIAAAVVAVASLTSLLLPVTWQTQCQLQLAGSCRTYKAAGLCNCMLRCHALLLRAPASHDPRPASCLLQQSTPSSLHATHGPAILQNQDSILCP